MDEEQVVEVPVPWRIVPGSTEPLLIQTEHDAALLFRSGSDHAHRIVVFADCLVARFGYPNDEALSGHPLYSEGLEHYRCYEVLNSSWRKTLEEQNRVSFPATSEWPEKHYVLTLKDSTFECLAMDMGWQDLDAMRLSKVIRGFLQGRFSKP